MTYFCDWISLGKINNLFSKFSAKFSPENCAFDLFRKLSHSSWSSHAWYMQRKLHSSHISWYHTYAFWDFWISFVDFSLHTHMLKMECRISQESLVEVNSIFYYCSLINSIGTAISKQLLSTKYQQDKMKLTEGEFSEGHLFHHSGRVGGIDWWLDLTLVSWRGGQGF